MLFDKGLQLVCLFEVELPILIIEVGNLLLVVAVLTEFVVKLRFALLMFLLDRGDLVGQGLGFVFFRLVGGPVQAHAHADKPNGKPVR